MATASLVGVGVAAASLDAPVVRRVRAYFAPVVRATSTPVFFDPAVEGGFSLDVPPAPWVSLGWIENFERKSVSRISPVLTGIPAAPLEQVREQLDAEVSCNFVSWSKLTMALATSSQHMNVLAALASAATAPDGAVATTAVAIEAGSTASFVAMTAENAALFTAGQTIVIDADNTGQTGYVGAGVSGAYLKSAVSDVDYVRRVSFNLAQVASVSTAGLSLVAPLIAGAPTAAMKAQVVTGFVDREGGTFFQEWSALFVMEGVQGERVVFHYPRLQVMQAASESASLLNKNAGGLERVMLSARFRAMPVVDPLDGERVLCYRSYLP